MQLLNSRSNYGIVSRALHWIIVFGVVAQWALAELGEDSHGPEGAVSGTMSLHQSIGLAVLLLAVVRVTWRVLNPVPAWPADMKPREITLARIVYLAFYVLLFAIPVSGWALASTGAEPLRFFNVFEVPRVMLGSKEMLEEVHEALFNVLVGLAVLHVIGAFKHWIAGRMKHTRPAT